MWQFFEEGTTTELLRRTLVRLPHRRQNRVELLTTHTADSLVFVARAVDESPRITSFHFTVMTGIRLRAASVVHFGPVRVNLHTAEL